MANKNNRRGAISLAVVGIVALLTLSACMGVAGPNGVGNLGTGTDHLAGFWAGLWHGLLFPITFIISLFTDGVSVYDVHNNGNWYDFGFFLGIGGLATGVFGGAKSR